jgi:hypothetical protein
MLADTAAANKALLLVLLTSAIGAGFGAWFAASSVTSQADRRAQREIQGTANVSIAALVALLGKLINFKKDLVVPATQDAAKLDAMLKAEAPKETHVSVKLELWPEIPFEMRLNADALFAQAGDALDTIQLLKMLDYSLAELSHLLRQRNDLIRQMNAHQLSAGALPTDGVKLYLRYAAEIARNVDEDLFFIDRAIPKIRDAAKARLPENMHRGVADVGLKPETAPLMPPKDLIKGVAK